MTTRTCSRRPWAVCSAASVKSVTTYPFYLAAFFTTQDLLEPFLLPLSPSHRVWSIMIILFIVGCPSLWTRSKRNVSLYDVCFSARCSCRSVTGVLDVSAGESDGGVRGGAEGKPERPGAGNQDRSGSGEHSPLRQGDSFSHLSLICHLFRVPFVALTFLLLLIYWVFDTCWRPFLVAVAMDVFVILPVRLSQKLSLHLTYVVVWL